MHGRREISILRTNAFSSASLSALAGIVSSASSIYLISSMLFLLLSKDMTSVGAERGNELQSRTGGLLLRVIFAAPLSPCTLTLEQRVATTKMAMPCSRCVHRLLQLMFDSQARQSQGISSGSGKQQTIPSMMIDSLVEDFSASSPEKSLSYLWRWRF